MSNGVSLEITETRGEFFNVTGPELEFLKEQASSRVSMKLTVSCKLFVKELANNGEAMAGSLELSFNLLPELKIDSS